MSVKKVELFVRMGSKILRLEAEERDVALLQSMEGLEFLRTSLVTRMCAEEPTQEDFYHLLRIAVALPTDHMGSPQASDELAFEDYLLPIPLPHPRPI